MSIKNEEGDEREEEEWEEMWINGVTLWKMLWKDTQVCVCAWVFVCVWVFLGGLSILSADTEANISHQLWN